MLRCSIYKGLCSLCMSSVEITHHWEFLGQIHKDSKVNSLIPIVLIPNRFSFILCMYVFLFVWLVFVCVYMLYVYMYRWVIPFFFLYWIFFYYYFLKYVNVVHKPVATRHINLFGKSFFSDFCYFIALILSKPNFISQFF